jgi:hypothetical protein
MNMLGILVQLKTGDSVVIQRLPQTQDTRYPNDGSIPEIQIARKRCDD